MTTYNGYELNYTIEELKKMTTDDMTDITLISKEHPSYQGLTDGDKKALDHLVIASKILNNVALIQDHPLNIVQKKALIDASQKGDEHATLALKLFNSLNGVAGLNGIDEKPITIFKNLKTSISKNFYPSDLSIEEFHNILIKMFNNNQINEIKKILSSRTMVIRENDTLKAID